MSVKNFEWPDEAIEMLRSMAGNRETLSATARAMSQRFGRRITNNAVIGKASRLGIHFNSGSACNTKGRPPKERCKKAISSLSRTMDKLSARIADTVACDELQEAETFAAVAHAPAPVAEPAEIAIPVSCRVALLDLRGAMCRWPMWRDDEPRLFCGARAVGGVYCGYHAQIAYAPQAKTTREVAA